MADPLKTTALFVAVAASCNIGSQQGYEPEQPIAFSHALHAGEFRIDCRYCHTGAERSRHAGFPAASLCMNCHTRVKPESPEVAKIAQSVATETPIRWLKVHRLPDFAWFSHENHVVAGQQKCETCHGPVATMPRIQQVATMSMGWCLDCHRKNAAAPTDCSACHL